VTAGVNERPYLSIGEVLGLLLEEFPDVTISKIRFLESQGLIDPERTASGYRKFYDADVERLRVILREQRENFLPLRVIRDRLENGGIDGTGPTARDQTAPRGIRNIRLGAEADATTALEAGREPATTSRHPAAARAAAGARRGGPAAAAPAAAAPRTQVAPAAPAAPSPLDVAVVPPGEPPDAEQAAPVLAPEVTAGDSDGREAPAAPPTPAPPTPAPAATEADSVTVTAPPATSPPAADPSPPADDEEDAPRRIWTRADICRAGGVDEAQLADLESFGLVTGRGTGPGRTYVDGDLAVVRAAAGFLARGIDARHLRAWRQSAEREASLLEQRILPLLRQRNPRARQEAVALLTELTDLGGQLREAIVRSALRHHLEP